MSGDFMTIESFSEAIYKVGRLCPHCGSFFPRNSLFCYPCEKDLLHRCRSKENNQIYFQKKAIPIISLFDWIPNESRKLSLLITLLKNGQPESAFKFYSRMLANELIKYNLPDAVIVPAPAKNPELKDHAFVLAKSLSEQLQLPMKSILLRPEGHAEQKELGRSERFKKELLNPEKFSTSKTLIFIDDVVTTGATAVAAYKALSRPQSFLVCCLASRRHLAAFGPI